MKNLKRTASMLLILTMIMSILTAAYATDYLYATGNCNLRKGPGLNYTSMTVVSSGTQMVKLGSAYDGRNVLWYQVSVYGYTGWVSSVYASSNPSSSNVIGSVTLTGTEYIRSQPNKYAAQLGTISKGTKINYYQKSTDDRGVEWYLVTYHNTTGWISSMYTTNGSGSVSKTTYISATKGSSNIRKGPGLSYGIIKTFQEGDSALYMNDSRVDERGVTWWKISYNGTVGWVSSKYTSKYTR